MKDVKRCFAVCPTFWQQPAFSRLRAIPGAFTRRNVFTKVSDKVFEYIYQQLDRIRAPTLLIVDDAAADHATNRGNKGSFSRLCIASPHLNLSIVGCFQRLTSASPAFRDNTEALVSFVPTKMLDVTTIVEEFNPKPAALNSKEVVKNALTQAWKDHRFCFIWREPFTGKIQYYCGFDNVVNFT